MKVEKFLVDQVSGYKLDRERKQYSQLSDHYGLSCELEYKLPVGESDDKDVIIHLLNDNLNEEQKNLLDNLWKWIMI